MNNTTAQKAIKVFLISFIGLAIIYLALSNTAFFDIIRRPILLFNANIGSVLLNVLGFHTQVQGISIVSSNFGVNIKEGCDAIAPIFLFSAAIWLYPAPIRLKLFGWLKGIGILLLLNIIRIFSLFLIGIHFPSWFDFMHVDFWQVVFILFTIVLWILWMKKANLLYSQNISHEA